MPDPTAPATPAITPTADEAPKSVFDAVEAELADLGGGKPDPQPGDDLPPPDSAPATPEGDGATDPSDNAPQDPAPKPDETKTEEPVDPKADDPKVEVPGKDGAPEPAKRPSDEFGELPKDAKADTKERFDLLKKGYDGLAAERDAARDAETRWIETVKGTGATPEQFGRALEWMTDLNSGTPEGLERAYQTMSTAIGEIAKRLGKEAPGVDPLDAHADLKDRVESAALDRADALEIAQARARRTLDDGRSTQSQQAAEAEAFAEQQLSAVQQFGAQMRAQDPLYAEKMKAIEPVVRAVVADLPPARWLAKVQELYATARVAPPVAEAPPVIATGLRPGATPGAGSQKQPGSALEAVEAALG